jgi:membrane AbrB-like protein
VDKDKVALRMAGALGVSVAAGFVCSWLKTPLPWMIGPLAAMAIVQFGGANLEAPAYGREAGQLVIGVSLGLYFTPIVMREVVGHWVLLLVAAAGSLGVGYASALFLKRAARVSMATAFFGSMPGGAAEMAVLGERHGAKIDRVALAHSMRLLIVVTTIPVAIAALGFTGTDDYRPVLIAFDAWGFAALVAGGLAVGLAARRLRVPNAFMIAPLIGTIAVTAMGAQLSSMPTELSNAAQVLLACNLGSKFQQSFLREAPRFLACLIPAIFITIGLAALLGWILAMGSGLPLPTLLLACAPGGIAEMSITAKVLRVGVPVVVAVHVSRYVIVVLFAELLYRLLLRRKP